MMYDQERAQQPPAGRPNLAEQHASPPPPSEPPRTADQPVISANDPDDTPSLVLIPQSDRDKLSMRLQQALNAFMESPRQALEEADDVFEEAVTQLTATLAERHRVLRAGWRGQDTAAQTEELRLALQQYRQTTELLLRM